MTFPSTVVRIRALLAKATPGPWKHESSWGFDPAIWGTPGGLIADVHSSDGEVTFPAQDNAALIVELVNNADALLAAAEAKTEWKCKARASSLPEPQDCDWPQCGCDPHATRVIEALEEEGLLASAPSPAPAVGVETVEHKLLGEAWGALNFILAFYEPGQTYLDTNAWKQAEASGRRVHKAIREHLDALSTSPLAKGDG